jgi:hypothetical protein
VKCEFSVSLGNFLHGNVQWSYPSSHPVLEPAPNYKHIILRTNRLVIEHLMYWR